MLGRWEGDETLQTYIKETVFPQIQQVNLETTETYYKEMRLRLQQTEWVVMLRTHPTWPDILSLPRQRKLPTHSKKANNHSGEEQTYRKELRQMQLWEPRRHSMDQPDSAVERTQVMEAPAPTQKTNMALQQIHRWLEESTMEEIHELQQAQRRAGSTLLRTLTASKRHHRQQQRSDRSHRQGMDEPTEESKATDTETTVTAITQWLTWITEVERQ